MLKEKTYTDVKVEVGEKKNFKLKMLLPMIDQNSFQPKNLAPEPTQTITHFTPCWLGRIFRIQYRLEVSFTWGELIPEKGYVPQKVTEDVVIGLPIRIF